MAVTIRDVEYIAALAHLSFSDEEKNRMTSDLNEIVEYFDQLEELDTRNVEPLTQVNEGENVFRDDRVEASIPVEETLKNAPRSLERFFAVPKVIGS